MKKLFLLAVGLFTIIGQTYAQDTMEEQTCFKLLNQAVKADARFDFGLDDVVLDESTGAKGSLATYDDFLKNRATNPKAHSDNGLTDKDFLARRNNIGVILASDNYLTSQIAGFGKDSNFDFPLTATGEKPFGDKYVLTSGDKAFKEGLVYTHHLLNGGDLLSCGIVKIKPLGEHSFGTLNEGNYKTNVINATSGSSSFEGEKVSMDGKDFYKMKVNMYAQDYEDKDLFKLEVISLAYNNKSTYFNEYITHPLQVNAMKNNKYSEEGLFGSRKAFLESVTEQTCLELLHPTMPDRCKPTTLNNDKEGNLFSFLLPRAYAKRDISISKEEAEKARGIIMYEDFPYDLFQKLQAIPDESFRRFIEVALTPNYEENIKERKRQGIVLSPYEEVFVNCGIPYKERNDIIIDFLTKLDINNIDYSAFEYSNPRFGDCVIPYPDKRHRDQVIEDSFPSNQFLAKKLNGDYVAPEVSESTLQYVEKLNEIEAKYQSDLNNLTTRFNEGVINSDQFEAERKKLEEEYNTSLSDLDTNSADMDKTGNETITAENNANTPTSTGDNTKVSDEKSKLMLIAIGLLVLGGVILLVFFAMKKKNK